MLLFWKAVVPPRSVVIVTPPVPVPPLAELPLKKPRLTPLCTSKVWVLVELLIMPAPFKKNGLASVNV